jgi:glycerol-3-phosphate acyltransferase PlsX
MNSDLITIAVDAMGGDDSPHKTLKGVEIFLKDHPGVEIVLFGNKTEIISSINTNNLNLVNLEIVDCLDNVSNEDTANIIIRNRSDSSISRGLNFIKDRKFSGFVSAGNTAAIMILSRLKLGMIYGIDRPAICSVIPNQDNFSIMLDLGANVSVNAKNLLQFALMGYCFHSILKPTSDPKIGIVNIGTEDNKGYEFLQEASNLISDSFLKQYYYGFIEPTKITSNICDIMICDGYTGNIILKTAEGMSQFITNNLKYVFQKNFFNKLAYKFLENDLKNFKDEINPDKYNGAILMGVNGVSIKSHGSATPFAFACAIDRCYDFITNNINEKISNEFNKL